MTAMAALSNTINMLLPRKSAGGGSHRGGSNSLSSIISTLAPVFVIATIAIAIFLWLRKKYIKVYRPRSIDKIVWQKNRRTPASEKSFFGTIFDFKGFADDLVLQRNSLDGYLFLRFFKVLIVISVVGCCVTWPILFPVNATGGGGESQLDILSFSNVQNPNRYYAHALIAWIFLGFVTLLVAYERMVFIGLRQAYFLSPMRASRLTSRTILFMSMDEEKKSAKSLREMFGQSARRVWMVTDCETLEDDIEEREKACTKLEKAQIKITKKAEKRRAKAQKSSDSERSHQAKEGPQIWMKDEDRPKHYTKLILGDEVDTITWSQKRIHELSEKIEEEQRKHSSGKADLFPAAFVEFVDQATAQRVYQTTSMKPCYIDVQPDEIIWPNLKVKRAQRKTKAALATIFIILITLFWTPIIAFVGVLTNVNYLTREVPFLGFIDAIPPVVLGVVTGLLPTILLAVAVKLVPALCRLLSKKVVQDPTLSAVELRTQTWYFIFQVIQVFLVTTFTSGASAVAAQIVQQPTSAVTLLAKNLPKASNFYISYFILYGLAMATFKLLSVVAALLYILLGRFVDKTPRKMYNRWITLAGLGWGSEYPKWTNLGVIAISYACIAPLVLGFASIGFTLLYLAFRYNWLFVFGNQVDMKGEAYSRALQQLMTGVYLACVCLIGLFAIGTAGSVASSGPLVLMVILLILIIIFQVIADYTLGPLEQELPPALTSTSIYDQKSHDTLNDTSDSVAVGPNSAGKENHHTTRNHDDHAIGNKLTQKVLPYVNVKFFEPRRNMTFELPDEDFDYDTAYFNPALTAEELFVWLARDNCGVSKVLIKDNKAAGIKSGDEYAWFDADGKLHWNTEEVVKVDKMINGEDSRAGSEKKVHREEQGSV